MREDRWPAARAACAPKPNQQPPQSQHAGKAAAPKPLSASRARSLDCPRSSHSLSTAAASAPLLARLTCARENAPHSDERAAKPRLSILAIRPDPFARLDAKLLPLPVVASVVSPREHFLSLSGFNEAAAASPLMAGHDYPTTEPATGCFNEAAAASPRMSATPRRRGAGHG